MNEEALPEAPKGIDPRWIPLGVTTAGTFMSILDNNIINVALPTILKDFNASLGQGQLVVTAYVMALVIVIPMSGFLGERLGMKRLYMFVLAAFALGSMLCGLAPNIESLILFRMLQGLGGGMLQPLGMAIVFSMITPLERPRFVAILGMPVLLAPLIGPAVGGYLVEYVGWRFVFFINVPVGIVTLRHGVQDPQRDTDQEGDAPGRHGRHLRDPGLPKPPVRRQPRHGDRLDLAGDHRPDTYRP